jgi:hypothetical protein
MQKKNPFVVVIVRYPFSSAFISFALTMITIISGIITIAKTGDEIFSSDEGTDMDDIRSKQFDALVEAHNTYFDKSPERNATPTRRRLDQAEDKGSVGLWGDISSVDATPTTRRLDQAEDKGSVGMWGDISSRNAIRKLWGPRKVEKEREAQQSVHGHVLWITYVGNTDNVFNALSLETMMQMHEKIEGNDRFGEFCLLDYFVNLDGSKGKECTRSFSPHHLFYSDVAPATVDLALFETPNLDALTTCAFTKLFAPESFALIPGCSAVDWAGGTDPKKVVNLVLQLSYTTMGCRGIQGANFTQLAITDKATADLWIATTEAQCGSHMHSRLHKRGWGAGTELHQDIEATLQLCAHLKKLSMFKGQVDFFFDTKFSTASPTSRYSRSILQMGFPLAGYAHTGDRGDEQDKKLGEWFVDNFKEYIVALESSGAGDMEILYFATPILREEFQRYVNVSKRVNVSPECLHSGTFWACPTLGPTSSRSDLHTSFHPSPNAIPHTALHVPTHTQDYCTRHDARSALVHRRLPLDLGADRFSLHRLSGDVRDHRLATTCLLRLPRCLRVLLLRLPQLDVRLHYFSGRGRRYFRVHGRVEAIGFRRGAW